MPRGLTIILLISVACARERESPPSNDRGATARAAPAPDNARQAQEIYIDSVHAENPLVVFGRARTFENTVQVRVLDDGGNLVADTYTTSVGDMGQHNPYVARLWLTQAPGARVVVQAFEYSANDGSERSLTADTVPFPVQATTLALDFPKDDCTNTVTVRRAAPRSLALARLHVEALVAGPDSAERAAGTTSPFPRGSAVHSVILRQGELTVDFNERLRNVGGACAAQAIRVSVDRTLSRLPGVRRVIITADGSQELALQP